MKPDELAETRTELEAFVGDVFASLPRADQRNKGSLYLHGLMLDGRRKSMQPMGGRLGIDYQQLQQFVSSSPWKPEPVRRVLVRKAVEGPRRFRHPWGGSPPAPDLGPHQRARRGPGGAR